jgi:hypothetical protein
MALGSRKRGRKTDPEPSNVRPLQVPQDTPTVTEPEAAHSTLIPGTDAYTNTEQETVVTEPESQEFSWNPEGAAETATTTEPMLAQERVQEQTSTTEPNAPAGEAPAKQPTAEEKAKAEAEEQKKLLHNQFPTGAKVLFTKTDWKGQYGVVCGINEKRNVAYINVQLTHYVNREARPTEKQGRYDVRPSSLEVVDEVPAPEPKPEPAKAETATAENATTES